MFRREIETKNGIYAIQKEQDGTYRITLDGVDKHGVCSAEDVISWFSNALFNAEYMLERLEKKYAKLSADTPSQPGH